MEPELRALEQRLGYHFVDSELLVSAVTHRSYANEHSQRADNERLEFLGDSVLGLVISARLFAACLDAREGDLSRRRASLVNTHALARVARRIELSDALRLGRGERSTGGARKTSVLANAVEALIGAAYIDGGMDAASELVLSLFGDDIRLAIERETPRDFKSELQELLQSQGLTPPRYEIVDEQGPDHNKRFAVRVWVEGTAEPQATGHGTSKKLAEREAARLALEALGIARSGE